VRDRDLLTPLPFGAWRLLRDSPLRVENREGTGSGVTSIDSTPGWSPLSWVSREAPHPNHGARVTRAR